MTATATPHQLPKDLLPKRLPAFPRETVLILVLAVEVIVFGLLSPYFLDPVNLLDTSRFFAESGLIALGMTLIIITGGIDLSVGSLLALVSVAIGFSFAGGLPLPLAIVVGVATGLAGGMINGYLISRLNLSPLTVTLGTFSAFRGLAYIISDAGAVSDFPHWFAYIGQFYVFGYVPLQLIIFVVAAVLMIVVLDRSRFGRYVRGIGTNIRTSEFSGVPVEKVITAVYIIAGFLVAVAALIYTSRVSTARANAGMGLELQAIAAVVLGGTSIKGGSGSITGTVLAVLILALLSQGLTLIGVSSAVALMIQGVVLIAAILANEFTARRQPALA
jgi:rhamnose transport system permease protein